MKKILPVVLWFCAVAVGVGFAAGRAHAATVIAEQLDGSVPGGMTSACNNGCMNVVFGRQPFMASSSAHLGSIEIFTFDFKTMSRYPETNVCVLDLYDEDEGVLMAQSDNGFAGGACEGDLTFSFASSSPFLHVGGHYRWELRFTMQNFTTLEFWGSATDTVGGIFSAPPVVNAKFIALAATSSIPQVREPVVVIPGIMGSKMIRADGSEIWPNALKMLLPGSDHYLSELALSSVGTASSNLSASDIIRSELGIFTFYEPLLDELTREGYVESSTLFVAPYDWRFGAASSAQAIAPVLARASAASPDGKINVIAHSMGGLVMKEYLRTATSSLIDYLILAGVPQLGTPIAYKVLSYGDDLGLRFFGLGLNQSRAKEIAANMPGMYELLPSRKYVGVSGGYIKDFTGIAPRVLNYDETVASTPNRFLAARADAFHSSADADQFRIASSSVYNLMGCGNGTIGEIGIYNGRRYSLGFTDGDGTVPLASSLNLSSGYHDFFMPGTDHMGLVQGSPALSLIGKILNREEVGGAAGGIGGIGGVSNVLSDCFPPSFRVVSTYGAVGLQVYDAAGRRTGPRDASSSIETAIPGSAYAALGDARFALLPASGTYRVAVGSVATGTFDLASVRYDGLKAVEKITYLGIPNPESSTQALLDITPGRNAAPVIVPANATDGTGGAPRAYPPSALLTGNASEDITPPVLTMPNFADLRRRKSAVLHFGASDDESGVALLEATVDGRPVHDGEKFRLDRRGRAHVFRVKALDRAGNPAIREVRFAMGDLERGGREERDDD